MRFSDTERLSQSISFQREIEFQDMMERLKTRNGLNADEESLINFYEKHPSGAVFPILVARRSSGIAFLRLKL